MPTTTNYGWTTPADTDLVKDGASAIRTLGSSIDSTLKTQIDAQIAKTIVDAKGDLIAGTASDTVARLAVGSNDQVLIADSTTATGLKWGTPSSGGMTLLSTTTLSGTSTSITSISQSYKHLYAVWESLTPGSLIRVTINNDTSGMYGTSYTLFSGSSIIDGSAADGHTEFYLTAGNSSTSGASWFPRYSSSSLKTIQSAFQRGQYMSISTGRASTSTAISSLQVVNTSGGLGGTLYLYGVS